LENKCKPQLAELMQGYKPKVIWFDYPGEINIIDSLELLAIIRSNDPQCLAGSRLHGSEELRDFKTLGDYSMPTGEIGETYWESLPGMQKHTYSYDQFQAFRPAKEIFNELKSVKDKGGNYLLAIGGPKGDGSIPEVNFKILREVKKLADEAGLKLGTTKE
jgi:alpha-L-fucosidase